MFYIFVNRIKTSQQQTSTYNTEGLLASQCNLLDVACLTDKE